MSNADVKALAAALELLAAAISQLAKQSNTVYVHHHYQPPHIPATAPYPTYPIGPYCGAGVAPNTYTVNPT